MGALTEDGGAAVVAPKGDRAPGEVPQAAPVLLPGGRILLFHPGLQKVLEVLHWKVGRQQFRADALTHTHTHTLAPTVAYRQ